MKKGKITDSLTFPYPFLWPFLSSQCIMDVGKHPFRQQDKWVVL